MLTLPITKDQLLFLIDQLSETEKQEILQHLIQGQPPEPIPPANDFNPRHYFGIAHHTQQEIDDYLATCRGCLDSSS